GFGGSQQPSGGSGKPCGASLQARRRENFRARGRSAIQVGQNVHRGFRDAAAHLPHRSETPHFLPASDRPAETLVAMRAAPTLLALVAAAAFGGFAATALRDGLQQPANASMPAVVPTVAALPATVDGQALPSLAPMLKRVTPSVVSVHSKQRVQVNTPFGNDPFFRRMFGIPQERVAESLGSGVIVDAAQGYVLTNHHVIEGADDVSVTLADGRTLTAEF